MTVSIEVCCEVIEMLIASHWLLECEDHRKIAMALSGSGDHFNKIGRLTVVQVPDCHDNYERYSQRRFHAAPARIKASAATYRWDCT